MFDSIVQFFSNNQQAAAALTLVMGGSISYLVRDIPLRLITFIRSQTIVYLEMDNTGHWNGENDRMVRFQEWYIKNGLTWMSRSLRATEDGNIEAGPGTHYFTWKGRLFWFRIEELLSSGVHFRKRVLSIYAMSRSETLMKEFFSEITTPPEVVRVQVKMFLLFSETDGYRWVEAGSVPIVKDLKPLTRKGVFSAITEMLSRYEGNKEWFAKHHMPYKRTLLLSGPPGTGKSTLALQLAMMAARDIYLLDTCSITASELPLIMANVPKGSMILFEDIHSNRELCIKTPSVGNDTVLISAVTGLSAFLNVLNGVIPLDDQIVVMTTNYRERLEPAVYRPGRVDLDLVVGYLHSDDIKEWLEHTYGELILLDYPSITFPSNIPTGEVFRLHELHRDNPTALIGDLLNYHHTGATLDHVV